MNSKERAAELLSRIDRQLRRLAEGLAQAFLVAVAATATTLNLMLLAEWGLALSAGAWQPTEGTIVHVDTHVQRTRSRYYLPLTYRYTLDDRTFTGQRICFFETFFGCPLDQLEEIARDYAAGDPIAVHYLPALPSAAVLDPQPGTLLLGAAIATPVVWLGSAITILPGYWILRSRFRAWRSRNRPAP